MKRDGMLMFLSKKEEEWRENIRLKKENQHPSIMRSLQHASEPCMCDQHYIPTNVFPISHPFSFYYFPKFMWTVT